MTPLQTHQLILMPSGRRGQIPAGTSVLDAAAALGVQIESICGGQGTCNKCLIELETGRFAKHGIESHPDHLTPPTSSELPLLSTGQRLACQAHVQGDVLIYVPEASRGHKQIIRKTASRRQRVAIDSTVSLIYMRLPKSALGESSGDWDRLRWLVCERLKTPDVACDLLALRQLQPALAKGNGGLTLTVYENREIIDIQPGLLDQLLGIAVDIGTTTVVVHLCDLRSGAVLATASGMNPQVKYGEDIMSRISYADSTPDGLDRLHSSIIDTLNELAQSAAEHAGTCPDRIMDAVIVGNTTMIHLLLRLSPAEIGHAPFSLAVRDAVDLKARDIGLRLNASAYVHILPSQGGHVGADNTAVLLAQEPALREESCLIVDVGTNAEIVLSTKGQLFSASSPTGPAFEGAQITHGMRAAPGAIEHVRIDPGSGIARFSIIGDENWSDQWPDGTDAPRAAGICGSGIIEVVAEMFTAGILSSDGRLNLSHHSGRVIQSGERAAYVLATADQTTNARPIVITQTDVRNVQLAKAALYAGIRLLMARAGVTETGRILLAGAFGSHIDPQRAMVLGLIPDCDLRRVYAVGNAAGDGALIALLSREHRKTARRLAQQVDYIELAADKQFQDAFFAALPLPHAHDPFPHLKELLPDQPISNTPLAKRRRPRPPLPIES